jgi:hypothetical protein
MGRCNFKIDKLKACCRKVVSSGQLNYHAGETEPKTPLSASVVTADDNT